MNLSNKTRQRVISLYSHQELRRPSDATSGGAWLILGKIKKREGLITRQASMSKRISLSLLFAVFVVLYLLPLTTRPLFIPDETRYAEVPREMINSGDWVVPRINGLRYFEKPVMGYWLTAASLTAFGENNLAVRLPAALSTGFTAVLIFILCSVCLGRQSILPGLAVFVYLTSLGVNAIGGVAVLDTPLTLFLTATLASFFLATEADKSSSRERVLLLAAGIFAGCAFLTKGFLAFAVPVLTVSPYLILLGRLKDTLRMLLLPVIGALLVSLPWAILIHQREPDFWNYFFWNEHVRRFLSDTAQHKEPFWYFLMVLPAMFMPWIFLLPAAVIGVWKKQWPVSSERRLFLFCLCWFAFPFLFFSASSGKLITYILPCFPPLAVLCAIGLDHIMPGENKKSLQLGISATVLLISLVLLFLVGLYTVGPVQLRPFQNAWKWVLLGTCLAIMLFLLLGALRSGKKYVKIILFSLSFSLLFCIAHFTIPSQTLSVKAPGPLVERNAASVTPETFILSGEEVARAVSWYLKRDDVYLVEGAGELQYGLDYDDSRHRLLSPEAAGRFIREHRGRTVLVARQREYSRWLPYLPAPVSVDSSGIKGYVFIRY